MPIDGLFHGDGDVSLMFLSANNILYTEKVDDYWYLAHQNSGYKFRFASGGGTDNDMKIHLSDEPASVLGCKFQYQACDSKTALQGGCSRVGGIDDLWDSFLTPTNGRNDTSWVWSDYLNINDVIASLRISALTSRFNLGEAIQGYLPDNQWQLDVEYWHNISLAALQGNMIDQAVGPGMKAFFRTSGDVPERIPRNPFVETRCVP